MVSVWNVLSRVHSPIFIFIPISTSSIIISTFVLEVAIVLRCQDLSRALRFKFSIFDNKSEDESNLRVRPSR